MKNKNSIHVALGALVGAWLIPVISASGASPAITGVTHSSLPIAAVRATEQIGRQVFSSDGLPIGIVGDFVFQFGRLPQLRDVIVKSGGFLGLRSDQRAVPADAITLVDGRIRVSLTGEAYGHLPVMPSDHRAYLSYDENLANMARLCGTPMEHAKLNADYILFSSLGPLTTVADNKGLDLGYFSDIWIDFNANEAPYLELDPANGVLDSFGNIDYLVPTTEIARAGAGAIRLGSGEAEFEHLKMVHDVSAQVAAAGEKLESAQVQSAE